ncbi:PREDICTED: dehydrin ERD10-like [Camelina sativa]|uniref:Dehydrin ERD10-like n=1 Tax=Camelina sativa TaxID=90675 RepID=A0ABM0WWS3_CAMSA|nr:PREDICTED: dehydrin ERD10-like [Camelina sativa]
MAEEYKNNVATEEPSTTTTPEIKERGMFDFLKKKEEVKPQETTTLASDFEHKTQISEPEPFVAKHQEEQEKEHKPTLLEQLHQKHEEEEENKPNLIEKLHRSNSSSSSSSDEEGEDGEKRKKKKDKKKILEGDAKTEEENQGVMDKIKEKFPHGVKTEGHDVPVVTNMPAPHPVEHQKPEEEEKKGLMDKIKEKLPGHSKKPEDSQVVNTTPLVETATPIAEHPEEKKGFMEKIKEKLPGYHAKTEEEKKEKESA